MQPTTLETPVGTPTAEPTTEIIQALMASQIKRTSHIVLGMTGGYMPKYLASFGPQN